MSRMSETNLKSAGTMVRERLGALLAEAGDAFEDLSFDPRWLQTDVARLPAALYHT